VIPSLAARGVRSIRPRNGGSLPQKGFLLFGQQRHSALSRNMNSIERSSGATKKLSRLSAGSLLLWLVLISLALPIGPESVSAQEAFKRHITVYGAFPLLDKYSTDIAKNYSLVITDWSRGASISRLKKINPDLKAIFYRDLMATFSYYDDWPEVSRHPDWFVRDAATNKRLVQKTLGWYLMDITNPGFSQHLREYILAKLAARPVFDGVFIDDVAASLNPDNFVIEGTKEPGAFNPAYLQSYRFSVIAFLQNLKAALPAKWVIINSDDRTQYIQHTDGIMLEGFVHGSWQPADYFEDTVRWLSDMRVLEGFLKMDKLILVHSGSQGTGDALQKQFLFCFASFLMLCTEKTYFFFDTPTVTTQLPPFPPYTQGLGPALDQPAPPSSFAATETRRSLSSTLSGWAATAGVTLAHAHGQTVLGFASSGPGAYVSRCIDLSSTSAGSLDITCSAKASDVFAGSVSWMRLAVFGKFYGPNDELLLAGADLPFDLGTYDWKAYHASYQLPPGTDHYCVTVGFSPSSRGTGWVKDLQIDSIIPAKQWFKRAFQKATIFVNPTNGVVTTGTPEQAPLQPDAGVIVDN